ncbi:putative mucin TcMUCII [Trypanosoma cruzi]|nr:putative mucin TcMUCII [Trypanosoma cruzi]
MMTCRLLCALLVLALCCCPSVCVTTVDEDQDVASSDTLAPKASVETEQTSGTPDNLKGGSQNNAGQTSNPTTDKEQTLESHSAPQTHDGAPVTAVGQITTNPEQPPTGVTESANKAKERPLNLEVTGKADAQQPTSVTAIMKVSDSDATAPGTTTTTTTTAPETPSNTATNTEAPTTTTTTTTTTTEAPIITSTEAPTTTTTRGPSHLRETDGSLSSSAWVCAPLLLAVSALAYNTVG